MVAERINDVVALVAYDGLTTFEFAVPAEIFGLERPELSHYYTMVTAAAEPGPIRGAFGLSVEPEGGLELIRSAGTVIVPGWRDRDERPPQPLLDALRSAHRRGSRLVSICSGAYVLAATGLLDDARATTHWRYTDHFGARYPTVEVSSNELFVDNGTLITSAGSAAGIDTCLHVVRSDFGATVANTVARRLVVSPQRDGGQAQHIFPRIESVQHDTLASVMAEIEATLDREHTVDSMAASCHMSRRTFQRQFVAETGIPPARWLIQRRVHRARTLLEQTRQSIEQVAVASGFGNSVTLRAQFRKHLLISPTAYRRQYGAAIDARHNTTRLES